MHRVGVVARLRISFSQRGKLVREPTLGEANEGCQDVQTLGYVVLGVNFEPREPGVCPRSIDGVLERL